MHGRFIKRVYDRGGSRNFQSIHSPQTGSYTTVITKPDPVAEETSDQPIAGRNAINPETESPQIIVTTPEHNVEAQSNNDQAHSRPKLQRSGFSPLNLHERAEHVDMLTPDYNERDSHRRHSPGDHRHHVHDRHSSDGNFGHVAALAINDRTGDLRLVDAAPASRRSHRSHRSHDTHHSRLSRRSRLSDQYKSEIGGRGMGSWRRHHASSTERMLEAEKAIIDQRKLRRMVQDYAGYGYPYYAGWGGGLGGYGSWAHGIY